MICNVAVDVLNSSPPHKLWSLSGFHSSARLCLGASSQFSTTHGSMFLTDRDGALAHSHLGWALLRLSGWWLVPQQMFLRQPAGLWGHSEDSDIIIGDWISGPFYNMVSDLAWVIKPFCSLNSASTWCTAFFAFFFFMTKLVLLVYFSDSKRNWGTGPALSPPPPLLNLALSVGHIPWLMTTTCWPWVNRNYPLSLSHNPTCCPLT